MRLHLSAKLFILLLTFSLVSVSCGDDPSSSGPDGEPPEFPSFTSIEPDIAYFEDNNPQKAAKVTVENFNEAKYYALSMSTITMLGNMYSGYFSATNESEAEYEDGAWVWDYNYSAQGQSISIKLTAEETSSEILWTMDWSFDDGQGNVVEDYTMIEGAVSKEGDSGQWTFNELNEDTSQETPILTTNWTKEDESAVTIVSEIYAEGTVSSTYNYSQNGSEFTISMTDSSGDDILVFWEEGAGGYYQVGAEQRLCWDADFQDVEC
ncbi:hypothetical protein [Gracilimonas mengyeensis]|uniref:Uncharacterized protein n=1 Tax=Gracilimonas mengyeensis TaxID=1302730 RepID=A0A521EZG0_9BACT|nr:hypothetical protein [Gracilimonas mengyeensis]SMO89285.1 hypothetical protein SAMN06265219_11465 [Gracilimonas mengyeensis]